MEAAPEHRNDLPEDRSLFEWKRARRMRKEYMQWDDSDMWQSQSSVVCCEVTAVTTSSLWSQIVLILDGLHEEAEKSASSATMLLSFCFLLLSALFYRSSIVLRSRKQINDAEAEQNRKCEVAGSDLRTCIFTASPLCKCG